MLEKFHTQLSMEKFYKLRAWTCKIDYKEMDQFFKIKRYFVIPVPETMSINRSDKLNNI